LHYYIGKPQWKPALGWWSVALFVIICAVSMLICVGLHGSAIERKPRIPSTFRVLALLFGVSAFVNTNFLRRTEVASEFVRAIVCLDKHTGAVRWVCEGLSGDQGQLDRRNSPATPTAVVDGDRVFAYFGTPGLICADMDGNLIWANREASYDSVYGPATSPIVSDGLVVIVSDMRVDTSYACAVDCATGETKWVHRWPANPNMVSGNSRTPEVKSIKGRKVVLVWSKDTLRGLDLFTGEELWLERFDDFVSSDVVTSSVSDDSYVYLAVKGRSRALPVTALGGDGSRVLWTNKKVGANCSSPVLVNGMLFLVSEGGVAVCLDACSGQTLWSERLKGQYLASPVASDRCVYFANTNGLTTVVRSERRFQLVAENDLGEEIYASFAAADGQLFVRTVDHLCCVTKP
jgi:outer membrane protein assembly factor BamB